MFVWYLISRDLCLALVQRASTMGFSKVSCFSKATFDVYFRLFDFGKPNYEIKG